MISNFKFLRGDKRPSHPLRRWIGRNKIFNNMKLIHILNEMFSDVMTAEQAANSNAKNVTFIAYHGTTPEAAQIIKQGGFKLMGKRKTGELGIHFGGTPKNAYGHKGALLKVLITLNNPIYINDYWKEYEKLEQEGYKKPDDVHEDPSFTNELRRRLLEKGYDGLIGGYENIVFNPSQDNIVVTNVY